MRERCSDKPWHVHCSLNHMTSSPSISDLIRMTVVRGEITALIAFSGNEDHLQLCFAEFHKNPFYFVQNCYCSPV